MLTEEVWVEQILQGRRTLERPQRTLHQLPNQQINRMVVCGKCAASGISPAVVSRLLRDGLNQMMHKIEVYREYGFVPEVSREKRLERGRRWRDVNQDEIREKRDAKERERRIEVIRQEEGL